MFSPYVTERLGYYVYCLSDPRDGATFYVGKGVGNRVFQHAEDALSGEQVSDKLARIRAIRSDGLHVNTTLLRHGLTEKEAFEVEAAIIQWVGLEGLTNEVQGHHVAARGRMSTDDAVALYEAPPIEPHEISAPLILFKIPKLWYPGMPSAELFEATRGWWRLGERRQGALYAAAVSAGVIREVYRIDSWRERGPGDRDHEHDAGGKPRWGFEGAVSSDLPELRNRSVKHWFKKGEAGVARYVNC